MGLETSKHADSTYQAKGDYATKYDLGAYVLNNDFNTYRQDTTNYLNNDLRKFTDATYQPKGSYALSSDLSNYQPKAEFDSYKNSINNSLTLYQPKGDYVLSTDFNNFQKRLADESYQFNLSLDKKYQPISSNVVGVPTVVSEDKGIVDTGITKPLPKLQPLSPQEGFFTMNYITSSGDSTSLSFRKNSPIPNGIGDNIVAFNANNSIPGYTVIISFDLPQGRQTIQLNYNDSNEISNKYEMKALTISLQAVDSTLTQSVAASVKPTSQYLRTRNYMHY